MVDGAGAEGIERLIDLIYSAALSPQHWPDVLARLTEAVGGEAAALTLLMPPDTNPAHRQVAAISGYGEGDVSVYTTHFAADDIRQRQLGAAAVGLVLADGLHLDVAPFRRSRTFNEFFAPRRLEHGMGVSLFAADGRVGIASIMRAAGRDGFDAAQAGLLQRLVPHLRRALQVHERLAQATLLERSLSDAIDRMPVAVLVLQPGARVVRINQAAERLLARAGTPLCIRQGRLAADGPAALRLARLLAATASSMTVPPIVRLEGPDGVVLSVMAAPVAPGMVPGYPPAFLHLLFVAESGAGWAVDPLRLAALFDLTAAEAAVAAGLASGLSLGDIAARRGASLATVRVQLRSLFNKTGTHTQGQLVALVARSLAILG